MPKFFLLLMITLHAFLAAGQSAEIGDSVTLVKTRLEQANKERPDQTDFTIGYEAGEINQLIFCDHPPPADAGLASCSFYKITNAQLTGIRREFKNADLKKVQETFTDSFVKINDCYFSKDFSNCWQLAKDKGGVVIASYQATSADSLPSSVRDSLQPLFDKWEKDRLLAQKLSKEEKLRQDVALAKKNDIQSKYYDLAGYNPDEYKALNRAFTEHLIERFENSGLLSSFRELEKESIPYARYAMLENVDVQMATPEGDLENQKQHFRPIETSPDDSLNVLTDGFDYPLPAHMVEGYPVLSYARIPLGGLSFSRGLLDAKVRKGRAYYFGDLPSPDVRSILDDELKDLAKGHYHVRYEIGMVLQTPIRKVDATQYETRASRNGKKILGVAGILGMFAAFLVLG